MITHMIISTFMVLGDWASLLIAVIVMVGVIIAVIAVACLVGNKETIIRGAEKYGMGA